MKRNLSNYLDKWRSQVNRLPLILHGTRQVGKTYLLQEWGRANFPRAHYVNFEKNEVAGRIFERDFDVKRILSELSFFLGSSIDPDRDLLIFDEVQACPRVLTSLKYFCEDMPGLALACAGSLLGVMLAPISFPVGKVQFAHLYPMSFLEFLEAVDTKDTHRFLPAPDRHAVIPEVIHDHLWFLLRIYYVTGGMPAAVAILAKAKDEIPLKLRDVLQEIRALQGAITASYERDFAKHSGKLNAAHLHALYRNIPIQLAAIHDDTTRRFQFGEVMSGKKGYAAWQRPIAWLKSAGLALQVKIANQAAFPLEHYAKPNLFKLMCHDIGLLGCMQDLPPGILMSQDFGTAKGYFAENYTAQSILASAPADKDPLLYCWQEGESEIEFLMASDQGIVPIEVKSGRRTKSRSLNQYLSKYKPHLAIRLSTKPISYDSERKLLNLPLYLAHWISELVE